MRVNRLILVSGDDWEGLYLNGSMFDEDHSIQKRTLANYMKQLNTLNIWFLVLNSKGIEWLEDAGCLPNHLNEIPEQYIDAYSSDLIKWNE